MDPNRRAVWVAAALYTSMESVLRAVPTTNVLTQRYMERYGVLLVPTQRDGDSVLTGIWGRCGVLSHRTVPEFPDHLNQQR